MSKFSRKGLMQLSVFFGFISFAGASEGRLPVWCFPCTTSECITQIQECSAKRNTIESMNGGTTRFNPTCKLGRGPTECGGNYYQYVLLLETQVQIEP